MKVSSIAAVIVIIAVGFALYEATMARDSTAALAVVTRERDELRSQLTITAQPTAKPFATDRAMRISSQELKTTASDVRPADAVLAASKSDPARLARSHQRYDGFVAQRGLNAAQTDQFFEILSDWDDASKEFQSSLRQQGLSATPEAQAQRNRLQQQIEVEPLIALLGQEGERAFFVYEETSFYRGMLAPFTQSLSAQNLALSDDQSTRLIALIKPNIQAVKRDPTSMASQVTLNWTPVLDQAASFLSPAQLSLLQAQASRQNEHR